MATIIGDALTEALNKAKHDVNNFVWKGPKVNGTQAEYKLMDCSFEQLQKFYKHANSMLHNTDPKNPGRLVLIDIIRDQIQKVRAERLVRWLGTDDGHRPYTRTVLKDTLNEFCNNNKELLPNKEARLRMKMGDVMNGIADEFINVPLEYVMNACLYNLGLFDTSHLTLNFITKIGLWFTQNEFCNELVEKDPNTGKAKNRIEVVIDKLHLSPNIRLHTNPNGGLSYEEFRSLVHLKKDLYCNLTTAQLDLLSKKILYLLQQKCEEQADQWKTKIDEIMQVAEAKGWDVRNEI